MLVAQITDTHITIPGALVYGVVDTAKNLERAVAALNGLSTAPDVTVITGDLVEGGEPEEYAHLRALLSPLQVPITADVFGLTATDTTDMGIGQRWEMFVDQVDVVLPMSYPSHYAPGTYGFSVPNAHPYAVIDHTLKDAKRRSTGIAHAAMVRPWYQAFTLGPPHYGVDQVKDQIRAGYENGVQSWILWNPGSRYDTGALGAYSDSRRSSSSPAMPACPNRCADSMPLRNATRASSVRPSDSSAAASRP